MLNESERTLLPLRSRRLEERQAPRLAFSSALTSLLILIGLMDI
jgi:hypothetical protein